MEVTSWEEWLPKGTASTRDGTRVFEGHTGGQEAGTADQGIAEARKDFEFTSECK